MAKIIRLDKVLRALEKLERVSRQENTGNVIVGYSASYAIYVHENLKSVHKVGQAKFLEEPARTMKTELAQQIVNDVKRGVKLINALLRAGLKLQRASQQLVPVDTGNLKNSAYTAKE